MIKKLIYICETCGKESTNKDEILLCEAQHLGLTPQEKYEWDYLKYQVRRWTKSVRNASNNRNRDALDTWRTKLLAFEIEHKLKNGKTDI